MSTCNSWFSSWIRHTSSWAWTIHKRTPRRCPWLACLPWIFSSPESGQLLSTTLTSTLPSQCSVGRYHPARSTTAKIAQTFPPIFASFCGKWWCLPLSRWLGLSTVDHSKVLLFFVLAFALVLDGSLFPIFLWCSLPTHCTETAYRVFWIFRSI